MYHTGTVLECSSRLPVLLKSGNVGGIKSSGDDYPTGSSGGKNWLSTRITATFAKRTTIAYSRISEAGCMQYQSVLQMPRSYEWGYSRGWLWLKKKTSE